MVVGWLGRVSTTLHCTHHVPTFRLRDASALPFNIFTSLELSVTVVGDGAVLVDYADRDFGSPSFVNNVFFCNDVSLKTCPWSSQTEESRLDCHEAILERQQAQIDELPEEANALRGHLEEAGVLLSQALVLDVNLFCGVAVVRSQWSVAFIRGAGSMQMSKGVQIP